MNTITKYEFFIRVKNNPEFKKDNREVGIYIYRNYSYFRYFSISTKNNIWDSPEILFSYLGVSQMDTFKYNFIKSKMVTFEDNDNLNLDMKNLTI